MLQNTTKKMTVGRFSLRYHHCGPTTTSALFPTWTTGRFGGGWQWEVGIQASNLSRESGTISLHLLVCCVTLAWRPCE